MTAKAIPAPIQTLLDLGVVDESAPRGFGGFDA
jgi:hypothetical protein